MYVQKLVFELLSGFFYDLIFEFRTFIFEIESWLYNEFDLQLSQDHVSFIIAFFIMVVYILAIIFTVIILYKGLKFLICLFVR